MSTRHFTRTYTVVNSPSHIFSKLLDVREWWTGLYGEKIEGNSNHLNDEFKYWAGDGAHYSKQKLVELIPDKRIVWLVTESELSFLEEKDEWTGTKLIFEFNPKGDNTEVTFTHFGLRPTIECYDACSDAWSQYLDNFFSPLSGIMKAV